MLWWTHLFSEAGEDEMGITHWSFVLKEVCFPGELYGLLDRAVF